MINHIRQFAVIIIVFVLFSVVSASDVSSETKIDFYESFDDTDVDGFDIVWAKDSDAFGVAPVYDNGEMCAVKTWVSKTRPVRLTHSLGSSVNSGMFYVSFDYYTEDKLNDCYLRLLSGDTQFQICGFRNSGKFGHFIDFSKWALEKTAVNYTYDTWYTVGILFDMESRNSYFYFGEQDKELNLIETVALGENFGNITDIVLVHSFGEYTPAMWDNVRVCTVSPDNIENLEREEKIVLEKEVYRKYLNVIYTADFETDRNPELGFSAWSDETDEHGIYHIIDTNKNGALQTRVNSVYPRRLTYTLKQPIDSGVYYITFDWKSVAGNNDCYLRLLSGDNKFQICGFRPDGNFGQFEDFRVWSLVDETESVYEADTWYTVGALLDMDLKKIYIYIGKQNEELSLCSTADFNDEMTSFTDVVLVHSFGEYADALWDNLAIYKIFSETAEFVEEKENVVFDEVIKERAVYSLSTEHPGNIFHNAKTADMIMQCYNRSLVYEEVDVVYEGFYGTEEIYNADGKYIVGCGEKAEKIISLPVKNKYGFFSFNVLSAEDGDVLTKTRFSNARTATDDIKNQKMGATIHMTRVKDKDAAFSILSKGGFSIIRGGDNTWEQVETQKDVFKTDGLNTKFYEDANSENFEIMTILSGSNSLYAGEYPTSNADRVGGVENPPQSQGLIDKFEEYCYQTVVMYPDVKYFQLWNEWNNAPTFNRDGITGASYYAKLLKAGYDGVKRGALKRGKDAYVVAMAPTGTKPQWIEDAIIALDGEKFFDIVSIHPYTYSDGGKNGESTYAPEDICVKHTRESGNVAMRIGRVKEVLDSYGFTDVPVWAGEFGFSSYICGEEKQAQYAVRMMAINDGNELLDKMLWYTFQNHLAVNETEQNYGMIRYDKNEDVPYEAKPAYLAMSNYNALMANAKIEERICDGEDGIYNYRFKARDGSDIYVVWTTDGEKNVSLSEAGAVRVYDIYGNERIIHSENGLVTFTASESVTYIKSEKAYLYLTQGDKEITEISDISDGDIFADAFAEGHEQFDIIVAQYVDGSLIDVKTYIWDGDIINIKKMDERANRICLFMWNKMIPLRTKLVIE